MKSFSNPILPFSRATIPVLTAFFLWAVPGVLHAQIYTMSGSAVNTNLIDSLAGDTVRKGLVSSLTDPQSIAVIPGPATPTLIGLGLLAMVFVKADRKFRHVREKSFGSGADVPPES